VTDEDSGGGPSWGLTPGDSGAPAERARPAEPEGESAPVESAPAESAPVESTTALDALFGESQFQPYEETLATLPTPPARRPTPRGARVARVARSHGVSRTQKTLISVAGAFVAVLALVVTPSATPTRTLTPTPIPTATALPVGPVAAGVHEWNELLGGECLDPYTNPWAEKFTVVDCAVAHPAQMVYRGTFDPATTPTFPGAAALQSQLSLLCAAPGVLDLAAAGQYADAQVQASYPVTQEQWTAGQHDYFCFISRSSGQPLTGSVAVPKAAPAPAATP